MDEWTNGDRLFGVVFSPTSWIGVGIMLCAEIVLDSEYTNKQANW